MSLGMKRARIPDLGFREVSLGLEGRKYNGRGHMAQEVPGGVQQWETWREAHLGGDKLVPLCWTSCSWWASFC